MLLLYGCDLWVVRYSINGTFAQPDNWNFGLSISTVGKMVSDSYVIVLLFYCCHLNQTLEILVLASLSDIWELVTSQNSLYKWWWSLLLYCIANNFSFWIMQEPEPIDWEYYRKGLGSRIVDSYKEYYDSKFMLCLHSTCILLCVGFV